ncbi:MAG: flippase-like domain-containing protein [Clostridiaceae bacterium]|nr:flippase-like domain-containing protein [Clostridiaceae bacterium]
MKNKTFNVIVLALSTGIMVYFFIYSHGLESLIKQSATLNIYWIILAVICIVLFWIIESVILHILIKTLYSEHKIFLQSFKFTMIGQFFGAVTPFSSGSQPAQIYAMTEASIPAGSAGSILMIKFIIHEVVYLIYLLIALLLKYNFFSSKINYFNYFSVVGTVINISIISFALMFSINNKMPKKIIGFIFKVISKFKFVKNPENKSRKAQLELSSFHESATLISKNKYICSIASFFTFLQWMAYYSIPYCIYRSFGYNSAGIFTMITAQIFLTMFMSCIPLPGAEGGAEAGFYLIFGIFFKANSLVPAIFIWRLITYYLPIAVGSIFTVILPNTNMSKNKS